MIYFLSDLVLSEQSRLTPYRQKLGNPGRRERQIKLVLVIILLTFFGAQTEILRYIFSTYHISIDTLVNKS